MNKQSTYIASVTDVDNGKRQNIYVHAMITDSDRWIRIEFLGTFSINIRVGTAMGIMEGLRKAIGIIETE